MATVTLLDSDAGSSASPTVTSAATITAVVGDWLLVTFAANNRGTGGVSHWAPGTISDSDGINTYITRANVNYNPLGTTNTGANLVFITAAITDALTNATISLTWDSAAVGGYALQIFRIRPGAGEAISFVAADTTGSTGNATLHSAATVSVALGNMIFGAGAIETDDAITGDSDTSNGSWSALSTAVLSNATDDLAMSHAIQWKTVTGTGNQSWSCSTTSAKDSARSYLVLHLASAAFSLAAALGQYTLSGTSPVTPRLGHVPLTAVAGSYALTGTAATFINTGVNKSIAAATGSYSLLGTDATLTHGYKLDATTAGSYALTGTDATLRRALPMVADAGSYSLIGTDAVLTKASVANKVLGADAGSYTLLGTDATPKVGFKVAADAGAYALQGSDVALSKSGTFVILADAGSYALVGSDVALTIGAAPAAVSPLHIGEWPVDKRKRRAREDAQAKELRARKRFRDAIGRLIEGLPPEFDEPADLDEALGSAVQAANLLYAMSAPIREINAVNELIDLIRQLRIAQPIAQLHLAQAYNQARRHLMAKAQEDTVMALLLGE